jgi:prophage DNA circulation protein
MSWRDRYRPASFRGVPFFVKTTDAELGRRVEIIKFPFREDTVAQDMGKDSADFSVQAYVIGDDYDDDRRALEAALLTSGPGQLILPTRGESLVNIAPKWKVHESDSEGGMATISFSCTVASPQTTFTQAYEPDALRTICDDLIDGNAERAAGKIDISGLSAGTVATQTSLLGTMSGAMTAATRTVASIVANVSSVTTATGRMIDDAETLLAAPDTLATLLGTSFESLFMDAAELITDTTSILSVDFDSSTIGLRKKVVVTIKRALTQILDMEFLPDVDTSTANLERETTNLRALSALYRMQAIGAFARALPDMPWSSYQEAQATKDFLVGIIEAIEGDLDDGDYEALRDLRVASSRYLESVALKLPVLRTYRVAGETCALLIAHELYGDARRESELVARNDIKNPANVPPTLTLEVSSV